MKLRSLMVMPLFAGLVGLGGGCDSSRIDLPDVPRVEISPPREDIMTTPVTKGGPPRGSSAGMQFNPGADN